MYRLINDLLKYDKKLNQVSLAKIGNVDQPLISRWTRGSGSNSFDMMTGVLRSYSHEYPEKWLDFMKETSFQKELEDLKDLVFLSDAFEFPAGDRWTIASEPAEFQNRISRKKILSFLKSKEKNTITYFIPEKKVLEMEDFLKDILTELEQELNRTDIAEAIEKVKIIVSPDCMCMIPLTIVNPLAEKDQLGFLSTSVSMQDGVCVQLLPTDTTWTVIDTLTRVYNKLSSQTSTPDQKYSKSGGTWYLHKPILRD